jgi:dephospho-CoA kinase
VGGEREATLIGSDRMGSISITPEPRLARSVTSAGAKGGTTSVFGVGLTGGIGSGKSAVADRLVALGADLIDADQIVHEVERPGGAAYEPLLARFGDAIRSPDGAIDRPALARIVFNDAEALADLNAITHPVVGERMRELHEALVKTDHLVVFAIPLLRPEHRDRLGLQAVVVVDCPVEVAVTRLVDLRQMDRRDALARIAAQISRSERLAGADFVVDNSSTIAHLGTEVARLWSWIEERRAQVQG